MEDFYAGGSALPRRVPPHSHGVSFCDTHYGSLGSPTPGVSSPTAVPVPVTDSAVVTESNIPVPEVSDETAASESTAPDREAGVSAGGFDWLVFLLIAAGCLAAALIVWFIILRKQRR